MLTCHYIVVNVPVLSEHITDVEPNVSTDSKFLTRHFYQTFFCCNVNDTVTVANKPSGTFATIIPIKNTTFATKF